MTAQTSEHGGFIRGQADEMDAAGAAVSTARTRNACANNLAHALDESGQFLATFVPITGEYLEQSSPSTTTFAKIVGADWRFPLRVRSGDQSSFRVVVHLHAYISAAGTATFRLVLRPQDRFVESAPSDPATVVATNVVEVSTTSTTGADLTATLYLSASQVEAMTPSVYPSEDGGAEPAGCVVHEVALQVWAKSSVGSSLPRIVCLTAREFAGDR